MMSSSAEDHRYGAAAIGCGGMRINHVATVANHTVILDRNDIQLVVVATWYNVSGLMSSGAYSKGLFFGAPVRLCGSVRLTTKQLARPKCL